jgi:iron complex outermembrane receptor protein
MRKLFFITSVFIPCLLCGQTSFTTDTVRISEIIISSSSKPAILNGFRDQTIDSSVLKDYQLYDISSVISENTPLFVKNYGPGAIATTSFRGTGASHTQLLWNDININSPMLGQSDFSLIPAGFTDEIRILNGAASMIMGYGGLGGTVNFGTRPDWSNETNLLVNAGAGSFGTYSGLIRLRTGTRKFQSVTRGYIHSSENNFRYLNDVGFSGSVMERRTNAAASMNEIMQEFYYRGDRSVTSANFWYTLSNRQLPSNMLVVQPPGSEKQQDESFRTFISHDRKINNTSLGASVAWVSERLLYVNKPASINSDNKSNTIFAKVATESAVGRNSILKIVLNNELNFINSVNYSSNKQRDISTVSVSDRTMMGKILGFSLLLRDIIDNGKFLMPDFSTGIDIKVADKRNAFVRLNFSRNSKLPSMNDLYWNPGGNPGLKNEYSYSGELSFDMKNRISERFEINPDLTFFASRINDMIQWLPGEYSYWTPQNISRVGTRGAEAGIGFVYKTTSVSVRLKLQYSYNLAHSIDNKENRDTKQLIYVPENQFNASLGFEYGSFYATFLSGYTGNRYTDTDNTRYLPAYMINDIIAGFRLKPGANSFSFCLKANNIFNVNYQATAFYPMPGRSIMFSVIYQFIKPL